jgi:hypothetical protein
MDPNSIQSAKWQNPERDCARVLYLDGDGKLQACYVPADDRNGDWRTLKSWVDAGGEIEKADDDA